MKSKLPLALVTLFIFFSLAPISLAQFTPVNTARGYPEWAVNVGDILAYEIPFPYVTMTPAGDFDVSIIEVPWVILGAGGVILVTIVFSVASVFPFFKGFERAKLVFSIAFVILLFFGTRTVPMIMTFANAIGFSWFIIGMIVVFVLFWFVLYKIFSHPLIKQGAKSSKAISDWGSKWISGFENFNKYDGISRQKEKKKTGQLNITYPKDEKLDQQELATINSLKQTLEELREKASANEFNPEEISNLIRKFISQLNGLEKLYKEEIALDKIEEKLLKGVKEINRGQRIMNDPLQGKSHEIKKLDASKYPGLESKINTLKEKINEFEKKEKERDFNNQQQLKLLESQLKAEIKDEIPVSEFLKSIEVMKDLTKDFVEKANAKNSLKHISTFYNQVSLNLANLKEKEEQDWNLTKKMGEETKQFIYNVLRENSLDTASDQLAKEIRALYDEIMREINKH